MLKNSSQELLHQMGQYLAWTIPRTRRFKFIQIKFLGSQMVMRYGDLYRFILQKPLKILSVSTSWNTLIFGMEHPWEEEIQVCSNKVPGVTNDHAKREHTCSFICSYSKNL